MSRYYDRFSFSCDPKTAESCVITKPGVRFSVLTPSLLRVEINSDQSFCDEPTQAVWFRNFEQPAFTVSENGSIVTIRTEQAEFFFSLSQKKMKKILLADGRTVTDFQKGNLKGTCRTLDRTDGSARLGSGVVSKSGAAVLDDSDTLILTQDVHFKKRNGGKDLYFFAYGFDYRSAVRDFFRLTGMPPLIPRYALGNWWSRYKAYTQEEYLSLMNQFEQKQIPLTVATVDMDWHWVKVAERFGKESRPKNTNGSLSAAFFDKWVPGWTGYSWNTDLFPDPQKFLDTLKEKKLKITLNIHPSAGVRFYEDAYEPFCRFMGLDPEQKEQILFDVTDEKFIEGYFRFLHHPHEESGVDFWWIDWQQGKKSAMPGLDPLWALNHYHYSDSRKSKKRPLILSRFAGAGSHRYPLGFSGDTKQTWRSLRYQPYFTATASNIGYTWWSHDIGGHCGGCRDDELYLRWLQYGVFSPINRLHSTANEFMGKEPWKYRSSVEKTAVEFLRLRRRLIPYLYSMNYRTHTQGRALIEPMYYACPEEDAAYRVKNQFLFGSELIVCPVTRPADPKSGLAPVRVWLPEGRYTDLFTDRIYNGGCEITLFRDEDSIPVLAHEGTILVLDCDGVSNGCENPKAQEVLIFRGNGTFQLYEDDGETTDYESGHFAVTDFSVSEHGKDLHFTILPISGDSSVLPEARQYKLSFRDVTACERLEITINGEPFSVKTVTENQSVTTVLKGILPSDRVDVKLFNITERKSRSEKEYRIDLLSRLQGRNGIKKMRFTGLVNDNTKTPVSPRLKEMFKEFSHLY